MPFFLQGRISMFCGRKCCEHYKTQKNILIQCECCKQEKVHFDTISYNQQDLVFCSESELTQKWLFPFILSYIVRLMLVYLVNSVQSQS